MKLSTLGWIAPLSMASIGLGVYTITPNGGFRATADATPRVSPTDEPRESLPRTAAGGSFVTAGTLRVEGRLGRAFVPSNDATENFVLLELQPDASSTAAPSRVALSIVVDKSGSMRGARIESALQAAIGAVERLHDGDLVTVHAFDTRVEAVVPLTTIDAASRRSLVDAIRGIQLGGDTCVSCGVEEGLAELRRATSGAGASAHVARMLVLSDGDTNSGVRDAAGFRTIAERALAQGVTVSTIGVDLDFNEEILAVLAQGSNGRHHFVESARDLPRVFEAEANALKSTVAANVVAELELERGVELVTLFDRTFSRAGSRIQIPLGAFAVGERKTVLAKVRVLPGESESRPIVLARVTYRDPASGREASHEGRLVASASPGARGDDALDGIVLERLQRSETADALREANDLFGRGKSEEAQRRLEDQRRKLQQARDAAPGRAPVERRRAVEDGLSSQEAELGRASSGFGSPTSAPAPAAASKTRKQNAAAANDFGL
jgi:Ca-activated chloride channel family protein